MLTACSGGSSDPTTVAADFSAYGVKGTINGQNITIDLSGQANCSTTVENMVIGINANGASISPDPRIARDYSQPVQFTLTAPDGTKVVYTVTVKGAACLSPPTPTPTPAPVPSPVPTPAPAPTPADVMPTGAVIADRWFSDNIGDTPMQRLNADGSFMDTYPVPANAITNTEYVPTATCFVGANSSIPNCFDPVHSYWSIDTSAVDPANRSLTYSMTVDAVSLGASILDMRANLQINPVTGKITQTCTPVVSTCFDSQGVVGIYEEFLVTVTAQPLGGKLPLVRTFKIRVRNDG